MISMIRNTFALGPITGAFMLAVLVCAMPAAADNAPVGTAFTYQGRLTESDAPVTGAVDMVFRLFNQPEDGAALSVLDIDGIAIGDDGRFTVDLDFGDFFNGEPRWLEIEINETILSPRQPIMASPHAMVATTAANVPTKAMVGSYGGITGVGTLDSLNVGGTTTVGGNLGIGTFNPQANLHINGQSSNQVGLQINQPGTSTGTFQFGSPAGHLGLSGFANNGNRRDLRFTDSGLALSMSNSPSSPTTSNGLFVHENGNVGIGTTDPTQRLHVNGRIFAETSGWAVRGVKTGSGTFPGVWGETESQSNGASGVRGYVNSTSPGVDSAGVYGVNFATNDEGFGVRGVHSSGGSGVFGSSVAGSGVEGVGIWGVTGRAASSAEGYGGAFYGAGAFGAGQSILATGESHLILPVGIGTTDPASQLHIAFGNDASLSGNGYLMIGNETEANVVYDDNEIMARNNGNLSTLHLNADGGDVRINQNGSGKLITRVLQITGGSDLAERFDVAPIDQTAPEPGMVACIDPDHPGKLKLSSRAYDRTVAGIISGAGGVNSGMMMGQNGSEADGALPVALTGRVYVMADATDAAIKPGDLLTTSNVPGHAMKVADYDRAQGAILGKAMTALAKGERGLVLVLVSLQ